MSGNSDLLDLTVEKLAETHQAILITDGKTKTWLPKSQIEERHIKGSFYEITLPEWLAIKKELI